MALSFICSSVTAFAQEPEEPDMLEIAENEADRLQRLLDLNGGAAKVSNSSMYISVQDKWMEAIDRSYKKIFTEEQWAAYLKSGAAKLQKAREKRKAKAEAALEKLRDR